jgi:hypothetical protein|tara:strand:+ start:5810 stop:6055 length:246 start_codon:yes stop_codon:yes gene_type:complete
MNLDIKDLVETHPNDAQLGEAIRKVYWEKRKYSDQLNEKMKDAKIFESPDGGKTIYQRPFGADISERTLVNNINQLNLFDD